MNMIPYHKNVNHGENPMNGDYDYWHEALALGDRLKNDHELRAPTDPCHCSECKYMKMNTLEQVRDCMKRLAPRI